MPGYRVLYESSFEDGFYAQNGDDHVTIPTGWTASWDPDYGPRPEFKPKDTQAGCPEVRTGRYAAGFFHVHSKWRGVIWKEFTTSPNANVRASIYCMGVNNGQDAGASIGINPTTWGDESMYQEWLSPYDQAYVEREWKLLTATGKAGPDGKFTVALYGMTREAIPDWNTHWDDVRVEVEDAEEPPIPPNPSNLGDQIRASILELESVASDLAVIASKVDELGSNSEAKADVLAAQENLANALAKM